MEKQLKIVMRDYSSEQELNRLCDEIEKYIGKSPTIVELGSYMGESALIFAKRFTNGKIICIDSWEGGFDNLDSASHADYVDVEEQFDIRMDLVNNIQKYKGLSTNFSFECDMLYIDACHKYECVVNDIKHWLPLTKTIISGHDYYEDEEIFKIHPHISGVSTAVNECLGKPNKIFNDGSWYFLKK
jgi:hypothetical protein